MENNEFKKLFNEVARHNGFESAFSGWFKEFNECIVVLDLQKSNFSNIFYLNIKTYIQGVFGTHYSKNKDLVKRDVGDIFRRHPNEYNDAFDLDSPIEYSIRKERLEKLFKNFIIPYTNQILTKNGIKELQDTGELCLLPAIKEELGF